MREKKAKRGMGGGEKCVEKRNKCSEKCSDKCAARESEKAAKGTR